MNSNSVGTLSNATVFASNTSVYASNLNGGVVYASNTSVYASNALINYLPKTGGIISNSGDPLILYGVNNPIAFQLSNNNGGCFEMALSDASGNYSIGANPNDIILRAVDNSSNRLFLQVGGTASILINSNNYVGIYNNTAPTYPLDVNGVIHTNSNIICSATGTIHETLILQYAYQDMPAGTNTYNISIEPGNTISSYGSTFNGGFLNGSNCSGETIAWNRGRLTIRSCTNSTNMTASTWSNVNIRCYNSNNQAWTTLATMTLKDNGSTYGYTTNVSEWFSLSDTNTACIGIQPNTTTNSIRIGPVYLNLSS